LDGVLAGEKKMGCKDQGDGEDKPHQDSCLFH